MYAEQLELFLLDANEPRMKINLESEHCEFLFPHTQKATRTRHCERIRSVITRAMQIHLCGSEASEINII